MASFPGILEKNISNAITNCEPNNMQYIYSCLSTGQQTEGGWAAPAAAPAPAVAMVWLGMSYRYHPDFHTFYISTLVLENEKLRC